MRVAVSKETVSVRDTEPLRILHLLTTLRTGGAEVLACSLANYMSRAGHAVRLLLVEPEGQLQPAEPVEVKPLFPGRTPTGLMAWPAYLKNVRKALGDFRPDVVHCHTHVAFIMVCLASRVPVCHTVHSTIPPYWFSGRWRDEILKRLLKRELVDRSRVLVVLTELSRREAARALGSPPERIQVVPNGIDVESVGCQVERHRAEMGASEATPVVAWVGRLEPEKNPEMALRGAASLLRMGIRFRLIMCGEGSQRASLEALRRDLGTKEVVDLKGLVEDVCSVLARARLFWFTSAHGDGHPLALIEAMAAGLPVVGTDVPGLREHLAGRPWARLVGPDDAVGMAEATRDLLSAPSLAQAMGRQAAAESRQYSLAGCAERYLAIYREICSGAWLPSGEERSLRSVRTDRRDSLDGGPARQPTGASR